ncbi:MAG TPA: hypothetical protein VHO07_10655 [Streptosporangiaceae bacterium]|jgi:hypothetical protein|nr:hypothetical protein [Streptosporangiaceae bacterium]
MIVFTTTLILSIAGRRRTCGRCQAVLCGIVVRIAGLPGFSMLLGASTCAPGLPRIAAGPSPKSECTALDRRDARSKKERL